VSKLPYTTWSQPGIGGSIRELSWDFVVEEVSVFEPSGVGDHVFVNLTKRDINTREVARRLAGVFGLPMTGVGYAGLKDRRAVSTQTFSLHLPEIESEDVGDIEYLLSAELPVKVNWVRRHTRKLRTGQLRGNRFIINVTGLEIGVGEALERAEAISRLLGTVGMPNYYGSQRVDSVNVRSGYEVLKGRRRVRDRWLRRLLVSSYVDHLCNLYLARRLECLRYWNEAGTGCNVCFRVCSFTKPQGAVHGAVKWFIRNVPQLNGLWAWTDDLLGYGRMSDPREYWKD